MHEISPFLESPGLLGKVGKNAFNKSDEYHYNSLFYLDWHKNTSLGKCDPMSSMICNSFSAFNCICIIEKCFVLLFCLVLRTMTFSLWNYIYYLLPSTFITISIFLTTLLNFFINVLSQWISHCPAPKVSKTTIKKWQYYAYNTHTWCSFKAIRIAGAITVCNKSMSTNTHSSSLDIW